MNKTILFLLILIVLWTMTRTEMYSLNPEKPSELSDEEVDLSQYSEIDDKISITKDLMQEMVLRTNEKVSKKTGLCTHVIETIKIKKYEHMITGNVIYKCMFMVVKHGNPGFDYGFIVSTDIRVINEGPRIETIDINKETYEDGRSIKDVMNETKNDIERRQEKIDELNEYQKIRLERDKKKMEQLIRNMERKIIEKPEVKILSLRTQPIDVKKPDNIGIFTNPTRAQEFHDYTLVRQSEIDLIKNNRFVEKEILDAQQMYSTPKPPRIDLENFAFQGENEPLPELPDMIPETPMLQKLISPIPEL